MLLKQLTSLKKQFWEQHFFLQSEQRELESQSSRSEYLASGAAKAIVRAL